MNEMEQNLKNLEKLFEKHELSEDELTNVVGGNDDLKGKGGVQWDCPFCGASMMIKKAQDAAKHMTKCPNNPYK